MTILWFAGGLVLLWLLLWAASLNLLRGRGGAVPVDNDRDVNPHYFADTFRDLLQPALESDQGHRGHIDLEMHRRQEKVRVYRGSFHLDSEPEVGLGALIVTGDLTIADHLRIPMDIWCHGNVEVGKGCRLRAIAGERSIRIGAGTVVDRWVEARKTLTLADDVVVVAQAVAGRELVLGERFQGGKVSAPVIRTAGTELHQSDPTALLAEIERWKSLREDHGRATGQPSPVENGAEWVTSQSVCSLADFWAGPGSVLLNDVVGRAAVHIGDYSVVAGSIHAERDLRLGKKVLVTGSVACERLFMEKGAVVVGAAHVAGDVVMDSGAVVGLENPSGGLAATGTVAVSGETEVTLQIAAGNVIRT